MVLVVTAPEEYKKQKGDILVFLAGGITGCENWQQVVIKYLIGEEPKLMISDRRLVLFNPRRENFPAHDKNAHAQQVAWERRYIDMSDIFSMYFCSGESDQPVCMFELGRRLGYIECWCSARDLPLYTEELIITAEDGYKRRDEVLHQCGLSAGGESIVATGDDANPISHAAHILEAYREQCYFK